MKNKHLYLSIILFLLNPIYLWAEEPLTLKDCFKAALKRSEVLATQQELVSQAEENYHRAWGAIFPTINGSYTYFHQSGSGFTDSGNTSSSEGQQTLGLTADQPLFRGFSDFAAVHEEKFFIKAQEQARQWAGMQLYSDVASAFYTRLAVQKDLSVLDAVALYKELTAVESGFRQLKDVMAMRPIYHQIEARVRAHIFVAALALLVQRLLGRRLQAAGVDLSPARAMQALATVRLVTFHLEGQPERRGLAGGCPDARSVLKALKLVDQRPPTSPEGENTVM